MTLGPHAFSKRSLGTDPCLNKTASKKKIAFFYTTIMGPSMTGGVGTSCLSMAEIAAKAGHKVDVFLPSKDFSPSEFEHWRRFFRKQGVHLILFKSDCQANMPPIAAPSYEIYRFLQKQHYDIVHFVDSFGLGYYATLAKRLGLDFQNTLFAVSLSGTWYWHLRESQRSFGFNIQEEMTNGFLERKSAEYADVVFSPTLYAEKWVKKQGWKLPLRTFIVPYPLNIYGLKHNGNKNSLDEIVFFGRMETRKGLELFCDAIEALPRSVWQGRTVTFLGPWGVAGEELSSQYLKRRSKSWSFRWKVIYDYSQTKAIEYLRNRNVLVVLASGSETYGYTLVECATLGIPFICSDIPSFKELVAPHSFKDAIFKRAPAALAKKLANILAHGRSPTPELSFGILENRQQWAHWHNYVTAEESRAPKSKKGPINITACLVNSENSSALGKCLHGLSKQKHLPNEVIVVDNRLGQMTTSEARNLAVEKARGNFILLLDESDIPKPEMVSTLVTSAKATKAHVVTCGFESRIPSIPVGDALECGLFHNIFGGSGVLVNRQGYLSLGGMKSMGSTRQAEADFFVRALLQGRRLMAVPQALYRHRRVETELEAPPLESSALRASAYFQNQREYLDYCLQLLKTIPKENYSPRKSETKFRFNVERGGIYDQRRSFRKTLFRAVGRGALSQLQWKGAASFQIKKNQILFTPQKKSVLVSVKSLDTRGVKRLLLDIKTFGTETGHLILRCRTQSTDGHNRWVYCERKLPHTPSRIQLTLNAEKFFGSPELLFRFSGRRVVRSIEILGEEGSQ
jgi:O-antigen biosynthesis protein